MIQTESLTVSLGTRSYEIFVGDDLIARAGRYIAPYLAGERVFVVTDENVAPLYLEELERALADEHITMRAKVIPAGEASKTIEHLATLTDWLLEEKVERRDLLLALGGGVVGDLAGFAAAVTLRGIDYIQVPTTLLAQVDSSVGGKTGINCRWGKNLIGAFHQPRLVLADSRVLRTLPRRELLAGYAEVVKYGLIANKDFFAWLEGHGAALLDGDAAALHHAVLESCRIKAEVVAADERETGARALLNLGHTFGHALEAEAGYGGLLLHGEAVAIGMVMAFDLSAQIGLCPPDDAARVRRHLAAVGLPTGPQSVPELIWDPARLLNHMGRDKKVQDGRIRFVLAQRIGKAFVEPGVAPDAVMDLLSAAAAA
jgi:3-dehydroquinate synthase